MLRNGQNKKNEMEESRDRAMSRSKDGQERSFESSFLNRKVKETSKLLIRHREKIEKLREQEAALEEELKNFGRVIEKVEKYEQTKLPNLSLGDPTEAEREKALV